RLVMTAPLSMPARDHPITSTPAHSSHIFRSEVGYGAIFQASRILNGFRERLSGEAHLTFNPGMMLGGTSLDFDDARSGGGAAGKSNVIAERARVAGDLRALSRTQVDRVRAVMREIAAASLPGTTAT